MHLDHDPGRARDRVDDLLKDDIRIGTVTAAEVYEGARKPGYKLRIDFGPGIGKDEPNVR